MHGTHEVMMVHEHIGDAGGDEEEQKNPEDK